MKNIKRNKESFKRKYKKIRLVELCVYAMILCVILMGCGSDDSSVINDDTVGSESSETVEFTELSSEISVETVNSIDDTFKNELTLEDKESDNVTTIFTSYNDFEIRLITEDKLYETEIKNDEIIYDNIGIESEKLALEAYGNQKSDPEHINQYMYILPIITGDTYFEIIQKEDYDLTQYDTAVYIENNFYTEVNAFNPGIIRIYGNSKVETKYNEIEEYKVSVSGNNMETPWTLIKLTGEDTGITAFVEPYVTTVKTDNSIELMITAEGQDGSKMSSLTTGKSEVNITYTGDEKIHIQLDGQDCIVMPFDDSQGIEEKGIEIENEDNNLNEGATETNEDTKEFENAVEN